jgi:hypothetical protein
MIVMTKTKMKPPITGGYVVSATHTPRSGVGAEKSR